MSVASLKGSLWVLIPDENWSARLELVPAFRLLASTPVGGCRSPAPRRGGVIKTGKGCAKPLCHDTLLWNFETTSLCFDFGCQGASSESGQRPSLMDCLRVMRESHFVDNRSVELGKARKSISLSFAS